jgi:glutamate dehydrogenase (NAD(P)+)
VTCVSSWDADAGEAVSYGKSDGVDLEELKKASDRLGNIAPDKARDLGYEILDGEAWLSREVEILIPAALEHQITNDNVSTISDRVRIVAEGANGPTAPEAEDQIIERGIFLIPDILANAGGVTCSYFEQVQSNMNYYWPLSEVRGVCRRL